MTNNNYETFKAVRINEYFLSRIAAGLKKEIYRSLFKPLFDTLAIKTIWNDKNTLINAINSGRIYYKDGAFRSDKHFSNAVATELEKLGANYRNKAYYINRSVLPVHIENALAMVAAREAAKIAALNGILIKLAETIGPDTAVKFFIEKATYQMFKKLQYDLEESTALKQVPVIDVSVDVPELEISDKKLDTITQYWEETDQQAATLHEEWKNKDKEVKQLKEALKSAPKAEQNEINKRLNRAKIERENARQRLFDFRQNQRKNAPNIDLNTDVTGGAKGGGNESLDTDTDTDFNKNNPPKEDKETEEKPKKPKTNIDSIEIDRRAEKVAKDYIYNMDYWVKNWKAKEIVKMRRTVLHMTQNGARVDDIKKYLQTRWGIAERKAEFLARNESGIASSVIKATHYQEMGCSHFMWLKSTSKEKRELHLEYAKKTGNQYGIGGTNIFAFNNPPIIDERTGQKGLPQQIYNCSCDLVGIKNPDLWIKRRKRLDNAKRNIFEKIKYTVKNCLQRNNNPWRYRRFGKG